MLMHEKTCVIPILSHMGKTQRKSIWCLRKKLPYAASHARKNLVVKHHFCAGQTCVINFIPSIENGLGFKNSYFA